MVLWLWIPSGSNAQESGIEAVMIPGMTPIKPARVPFLGRCQAIALRCGLALLFVVGLAMGAQVPVFVGAPDSPAQSQNPVVVPLFLSNFSTSDVNQVAFSIEFDATRYTLSVIRSLVDPDFNLIISDSNKVGSRRLTFTAPSVGQAYGSLQIAELEFTPVSGTLPATVQITNGVVNGNSAQTMAASAFNLTTAFSSRADIDRNGQVNLADVDSAFNYLLRTPAYNRDANAFDFSGKWQVNSMDVALLNRHVLGFYPTLPAIPQQADTNKSSHPGVTLTLSAPSLVSGDYYQYTLSGTSVKGLLAGEFALSFDASIFQSISTVESPFAVNAGGVVGRPARDSAANQLHLYLAASDSLTGNGILARFTVKHKPGKTGTAFKIASAYLNEGTYSGNFVSRPNGGVYVNTATPVILHALRTMAAFSLQVLPYGMQLSVPFGRMTLELLDVQGRVLFTTPATSQQLSVQLPVLTQARVLRLRSDAVMRSWLLP
jgi:hypothetical protein